MTRLTNLLAGLAAAGLLLSQPAAAASAGRTGASIDESEGLAGDRAAGPAIAVILFILLIAALPLFDDDDDGIPSSP